MQLDRLQKNLKEIHALAQSWTLNSPHWNIVIGRSMNKGVKKRQRERSERMTRAPGEIRE